MKKIWNIALCGAASAAALFAVSMASSSVSSLPAPADQEAFVNAAEHTINGVVSVKSFATPRQMSNPYSSDPLFEFFFGGGGRRQQPQQPQEEGDRQIGLGSGVIISEDGYIVTNNHVIAEAERLEVTLNDNRNYDAKVIGTDPVTDLALIKIDAPDLHVIPMGNSEDLRVGEWVLAVGNPFGFTSTVTSGIVSAKARNISSVSHQGSRGIESYIQTDAALNAGNSGGALVNLKGELVGINTAIYSQTGNYAGCSFAIPTSIVNKVIGDIKDFGAVQRALLGITFEEVTPELIKKEDIKGVTAGLMVRTVVDGSAAVEAGLDSGDVIVSINGAPTTNTAQIQEALAKCSPGDKVTIEYVRDGKTVKDTAVLRNSQGNTKIVKASQFSDLGCSFEKVSEETAKKLGIRHGVEVAEVGDGPMRRAGVKAGFVITSINGYRMTEPKDVEKLYNQIMKDDDADKVLFIKGVHQSGQTSYFAVPIG
ncbi:MAG: Do family serine endopeptidase [Clostridium sp.]|nr:Do family serine endopeptidase [Clostridium sp.]